MGHYDEFRIEREKEIAEKEKEKALEEINETLRDEELFFVRAALKLVKNLRAIISAGKTFQEIIQGD